MKMRVTFLAALLVAFTVVSVPAWSQDACSSIAGNLVVNCGFETGDFSGWTQTGNTGNTTVTNTPADVFSGTFAAKLGPVGSDGFLTQTIRGNTLSFQFRNDPSFWNLDTIALVPVVSCGTNCEIYNLSFWLQNLGGGTNDFTTLWNGVDVGPSLVNSNAFTYVLDTGTVEGFNTTTVPEPSSLILMGSGLLGLAGVIRRKLMA